MLTESACSTNVTFVPGAKPITPESIVREARLSRKNVPSGARRGYGAMAGPGVGLATTRLAEAGRAATGFGLMPSLCLGRRDRSALRWSGRKPAPCPVSERLQSPRLPILFSCSKRRRIRPKPRILSRNKHWARSKKLTSALPETARCQCVFRGICDDFADRVEFYTLLNFEQWLMNVASPTLE